MCACLTITALLWSTIAAAGTVQIQTDGPTEIRLGEVTIGRATSAGTLDLPDLPPGKTQFTLVRTGHAAHNIDIDVPASGVRSIRIAGGTVSIDDTAVPLPDLPAPIVILQSIGNQRFSVLLDGQAIGILEGDMPLEGLAPGPHDLEFRTTDNLVIWSRGVLTLEPGDTLTVRMSEGHMPKVDGRADSWQARPDARSAIRKPSASQEP